MQVLDEAIYKAEHGVEPNVQMHPSQQNVEEGDDTHVPHWRIEQLAHKYGALLFFRTRENWRKLCARKDATRIPRLPGWAEDHTT